MSENIIKYSHYEKNTKVLGPGTRFVVWFQGCKKRCDSCINPEGRDLEKGQKIEINELVKIILETKNINGITISGGEPFLQFLALKKLVFSIKESSKLDIMLFSGYTYEELCQMYKNEDILRFFDVIDIFIDGEYIKDLDENQMYRGSENQNIYTFTGKYDEYKDKILKAKNRDIEFSIDENGNVFMTGIPPKDFYQKFVNKILS